MIELALGLRARDGMPDVAAGIGASRIAVADGLGGHGTGWLGARRVVRSLVETGTFVGAASDDDLAEASRRWTASHASSVPVPRDLVAAFHALDQNSKDLSLAVGCIAATIDGNTLHGAHAGRGRAAVIRTGIEELVAPHLLDRFEPGAPPHIVCSALGMLGAIGIECFSVTLAAGEVLLLASSELDLDDATLIGFVHSARSIDELARAIEESTSVAFVLARAPG